MVKLNCWEFTKCGREPGGVKVKELGACPAATEFRLHGINCGKNAGRACWPLAGTLCGDKVQGSFASKIQNCLKCEFYIKVSKEEGKNFSKASEILAKLNASADSKGGYKP